MIAYYKIIWCMADDLGKKQTYDLTTHSAKVADMLLEKLQHDTRCSNVICQGVEDDEWP